jgi:putative DNA-invertase from lambdoid prophage Rac
LLDRLEQDDVLIVTQMDRLGRNTIAVCSTVVTLGKKAVFTHVPTALIGLGFTQSA